MALKDIETKKGLYVRYRNEEGDSQDGIIDEVYTDSGIEKVNLRLGPKAGTNKEARAHGVERDDSARKKPSWKPATELTRGDP
jgi:hypothetical protein